MTASEIALILADTLRKIEPNAGQSVLDAVGISAVIFAFAGEIGTLQPVLSADIAFSSAAIGREIAPVFAHSQIALPEINAIPDGAAGLDRLGDLAKENGHVLLYLDMGTEDSPVFLLPQAMADPLLDIRSGELAEQLGLPPGPPVPLMTGFGVR